MDAKIRKSLRLRPLEAQSEQEADRQHREPTDSHSVMYARPAAREAAAVTRVIKPLLLSPHQAKCFGGQVITPYSILPNTVRLFTHEKDFHIVGGRPRCRPPGTQSSAPKPARLRSRRRG